MLKDSIKNMFANYASPYPYMTRNGWEDVANYGVSRPTLENVLRARYGNILNSAMNNVDANKYSAIYDALQRAYGNNQLMMLQNEARYNPNFYQYAGM